jgi:hypothetical protein
MIVPIARKLALLAIVALSATALASPSTFGQETEPELHNQTPKLLVQQEVHAAGDVSCPAALPNPAPVPSPTVTSGGCRLHMVSEGPIALWNHGGVGGVEIFAGGCNMEFDVRIDSAGEGWLSHQELTDEDDLGPCWFRVCGQVDPPTDEGRAFSFHLFEGEPAPREHATILFCFNDGVHCEYTFTVSQTATHRYAFTIVDQREHGTSPLLECGEWSGRFVTEAGGPLSGEGAVYQNVEIRHP